jgi:hypothetical protein
MRCSSRRRGSQRSCHRSSNCGRHGEMPEWQQPDKAGRGTIASARRPLRANCRASSKSPKGCEPYGNARQPPRWRTASESGSAHLLYFCHGLQQHRSPESKQLPPHAAHLFQTFGTKWLYLETCTRQRCKLIDPFEIGRNDFKGRKLLVTNPLCQGYGRKECKFGDAGFALKSKRSLARQAFWYGLLRPRERSESSVLRPKTAMRKPTAINRGLREPDR